jgi:hypothetical protein
MQLSGRTAFPTTSPLIHLPTISLVSIIHQEHAALGIIGWFKEGQDDSDFVQIGYWRGDSMT